MTTESNGGTVSHSISRRTLLGGAFALATIPLLASCTPAPKTGDVQALNAGVKLPTYVRWEGPTPDLPRVEFVPDAFYKYPKAVEVLADYSAAGAMFIGTVKTSAPVPPGVDSNEYWKELNRRIDADVKLTITPNADWPSKFASSVAGDALGDIWNIVSSFPNLPQLLESKAQDLTEYLSGDAVKKYPFLANLPEDAWRGCVFNGKIFAVPIYRGILGSNTLISRADLFKERDVSVDFANTDELLAIGREMTDARSNRWAFADVPDQVLSAMLGLPNQWQEKRGKFTNAIEFPEHQEMLEFGRLLMSEGLVHPDNISAPEDQSWFLQGSAAMMQGSYAGLPSTYQQNTSFPDYEIGLPVILGPDGKPRLWQGRPNNSITGITKAEPERIKAVLEFLNWCAAPFGTEEYTFRRYGIEGRDFEFVDGEPQLTQVGNSETSLGSFPIQYLIDSPPPVYFPGYPDAVDIVYENLIKTAPNVVKDPTLGLYSPTNSTQGASLTSLLTNATNDIFLGRAPVSSWPAVVKDWRAKGGDAVRKEFEQALAARDS